MENRRNFLRQSGLATAAFMLAKPSENIASLPQEWFSPVVKKVKLLYSNQALQHAGNTAIHVNKIMSAASENSHYSIQKKNGISIGFINGDVLNKKMAFEHDRIQIANETAASLKKQGCQLIAFVEGQHGTEKSCEAIATHCKNIDILFSRKAAKLHFTQRVMLNQHGHEVIVSYLPSQAQKSNLISFGFDANGKKNFFEIG